MGESDVEVQVIDAGPTDGMQLVHVTESPNGSTNYIFILTAPERFGNGAVCQAGRWVLIVPKNPKATPVSLVLDSMSTSVGGKTGLVFTFGATEVDSPKGDDRETLSYVRHAISQMPTPKEAAIPTRVLNAELTRNDVSHAFAAKSLEGLFEIAHGQDGIYRHESKSGSWDAVELRATPGLCRRFYSRDEANHLYSLKVLATIRGLLSDKKAVQCEEHGRVWITESTILREMTRTEQGVSQKVYRKTASLELLHSAIEMLSSASLGITLPDGTPLATEHVIDASFRETILSHGKVIKNAWGFVPEVAPLFNGELAAYTGSYNMLPLEPLSDENTWMPYYVADLMHELRGKLFPKKGRPSKSATIKRSWDGIFAMASPANEGTLRSYKKQKIVRSLLEVLEAVAEKEASPEGFGAGDNKRMWIKATITRDPSRGKGKGAWGDLEITAYSTLHKIEIDAEGMARP